MFSVLEVILIFLAMESWVILAKYLAKKNNISIIQTMIISFFYSLMMWGIMCIIANIFMNESKYTLEDAYNVITIMLSIFLMIMTALICYKTRKDNLKVV